MARIKRRAARRLWRRSREEKRRLSEGGGGTTRREENSEAVEDGNRDPQQTEAIEVAVEQIDRAYRYMMLDYDEEHESLLLREHEIIEDIERLQQRRASLEDKILAVKMVTRSFDYEKVKKIKSAERQSNETWGAIGDLESDLKNVRLAQTKADAMLRSCNTIVNQNVRRQGNDNQGLLLGFLGHIWRL